MPTLAEHAQQEVDRLALLETAARSELSLAQADLDARKPANEVALAQLGQADAKLAMIRKELGGSEVPADASSGGAGLHDALIAQRDAAAKSHAARLTLLAAEDRRSLAKEDLDSIAEGLRRARATLAEYPARDQQLASWMAALEPGTPLAALPADASALLIDASFTAAEAKLAATLPDELRTRVIERFTMLLDDDDALARHVAALESEVDRLLASTDGIAGAVPTAERKLTRAEVALGDYVVLAPLWMAEARMRIGRISERRSIGPDERAALDEALGDDASRRSAAITAEHDFDVAAHDLAAAKRELDRRLAVLHAATSTPAVDADAQVITLRNRISAAQAAMVMPDTSAVDMHAWQAEVPDFAWDDLLDLLIAERLLAKIAAINPSDLVDAVSRAEADLVTALEAEHDADLRLEAIDTLLAAANRTFARARKTGDERRSAAIRGLR